MLTNPIVLDVETTIEGPNNSPEAHFEENRALLWGWAELPPFGDPTVNVAVTPTSLIERIDKLYKMTGERVTIIAHNAKFDLKWLMQAEPSFNWQRKVTCYCTMYAEYRLAGHNEQYMSLENACASRGINFKKSLDLHTLLASGIKMEDIPSSDLTTYLEGDVLATMQLFCAQTKQDGIEDVRHGHIMALAAIELNGLALHVLKTKNKMSELATKRTVAQQKLRRLVEDHIEWDYYTEKRGPNKGISAKPVFDVDDINTVAPRTISFILTGHPRGAIKKGVKRLAILKKDPLLTPTQIASIWKDPPSHLGFTMDEESLDKVDKILKSDYMDTIMEFRQCTKLMNTYLGPFLEQATRPASTRHTVHPSLNYVRTATGRLSSSNPNGQNMPEIARQMFWSKDGVMAEIDFKQLEVVALAHLSGCPALRKDLLSGIDIHYQVGKTVFGWTMESDMTETDRKKVKSVVFGVLFGGTAYGLSLSTGLSRKLVQSIIDSLYSTYPGIERWHYKLITMVGANKYPDGFLNGQQRYTSDYVDPKSKRKFRFKTHPNKYQTSRAMAFRPTQIKNYPVQGFAGGDIVMIAIENLWRRLDKSVGRLRMTVHDSIVVDWKGSKQDLEDTMDLVCLETKRELGIKLPLLFDVEYGKHWSLKI